MEDAQAELLARLHDIQPAAPPGWWPPAPGWIVLAVLAMIALVLLLQLALRRWRVFRRRRRLLRALQEIQRTFDPQRQPREFLAGINRLFRVVALRAFGGTNCARLHGAEWVEFIACRLPPKAQARAADLAALAAGPYQPEPSVNPARLAQLARTWVLQHG